LQHEALAVLLIVRVLGVEGCGSAVFLQGAGSVSFLLESVAEAGVECGIIGA
jgi:hypothetical protein